MTKRIHVHLHTTDAGWDESKHKRDHGKFASTAGPGTETHHSKMSQGMGIYDKSGKKVDEVSHMTPAMRASERTVHTRAGYEHVTQGGHLPNGLHVKSAHPAVSPEKKKQLEARQATLREQGSPRYSGRTTPKK